MKIDKSAQKLYKKSKLLLDKGNIENGAFYLNKAANKGYAPAQYRLGNFLRQGAETSGDYKDIKKAIEWLELAGKQGHVNAQFVLGKMYEEGIFVPKDDQKAFNWISPAAEQGHAKSQGILGLIYRKGVGGIPDYEKAVHWLTLAAEKGEMYAQNNLGILYKNGDGVELNLEVAVRWLEEAAKQGLSQAQNSMGCFYLYGEAIEKDLEKAFYWFKKAAEQGYSSAQSQLGFMYTGGLGIEKNLEQAIYWYELASKKGEKQAKTNLGIAYLLGDGVKSDKNLGFDLLKQVADNNHPVALYNLGLFYAIGWGTDQNYSLAFDCFISAAEKGEAVAQYVLGELYATGWQKIEKDVDTAIHWLTLGLDQGIIEAKETLDKLQTKNSVILPFNNDNDGLNTWLISMVQSWDLASTEQRQAFLQKIKTPIHIFEKSINELLLNDENQEVEFKETFSVPTKKTRNGETVSKDLIRFIALQEITGFLNTNDGILLIGVADGKNTDTSKPEISGIEQDEYDGDKDKYSRTILDIIKSAFGETAASLIQLHFENIGAKTVCRIHCKKSVKPVYCTYKNNKNKAFVRCGSSTSEPPQMEWHRWITQKFPST